jgi:hypothetical protein
MSKTYKGDVTGNVVELNLLDANEGTLPNLGTPTVVTKNTGPNVVEQIVGGIPDDYYSFGSNGGYDVKGLVIGTSCTSIGSQAFYYCFSLKGNLIIPNSVTTIGSNAFKFYSSFNNSLTIPNSVTSIGSYAFGYIAINAVYINTPASSFTGTNAFGGSSFSTIYTGPSATGYTTDFQGRTGLTISTWTNYPNIP